MKIQARMGTFETNSSSTHAICISEKPTGRTDLPAVVEFSHGEFGWEYKTLTGVNQKASYLYQAICDVYFGQEDEKEACLQRIRSVLGKHDITCEFEKEKKGGWVWDGIDHGDECKDFVKAVLADEDKLMTYLFGDAFVITGNDNDDDFRLRMHPVEGIEHTSYGDYVKVDYSRYDPEFDGYHVYEKGN